MSDGPYSRVYHTFPDEYKAIYADDRLLAAWLRLLVVADAAWPLRPPMPRSVKPAVLRALTGAGVVILDGDAYTVLGLDAERTRRREAGRTGAAMRWQSERNADRNAKAMPSKAEQSKDEQKITPPPHEGRRKDGTNPRAVGANPRANGTAPRQLKEAEKRGGLESLAAIVTDPRFAQYRPAPKAKAR